MSQTPAASQVTHTLVSRFSGRKISFHNVVVYIKITCSLEMFVCVGLLAFDLCKALFECVGVHASAG